MLARVVDQVGERAGHQRRIGHERQRRHRRRQLVRAFARTLERAPRDLARLQRLARDGLELQPRAREQLAHQRVDLDRLAFDVVERGRGDARLARDLDQQADPRERRPQLVRHGRQQLALLGQLLLQPDRHVVEGRRQHRDLADAAVSQRRARGEVALPQLLRHPRQLVDRPRDATRDPPRRDPQAERRDPEQEDGAPRVRGQPGAAQVRRDDRRADAEEDRHAEPPEQPVMQVRPVVQPQILADAQPPAGPALAGLADHAVPGKRRAAREVAVPVRRPAIGAVAMLMAVMMTMAVPVPAHAPSSPCACAAGPSAAAIT